MINTPLTESQMATVIAEHLHQAANEGTWQDVTIDDSEIGVPISPSIRVTINGSMFDITIKEV